MKIQSHSSIRALRRVAALVLLVVAVPFVAGCSDDDPVVGPGPLDMGNGSKLRAVHASPDAPPVDIYAEGVATPLAQNVAYGETTPYLDLAAGMYNIQLRAAGSSPTSAPAYETGDVTVPDGVTITAIAMGLLGSSDADQKFRVIPYVENFSDPGSNATVRIIHASADAPTVALDVGNDGNPEVTGFARFDETGEAGVALPSGTELQIAVWAGSPLSRVTVFTTPQLPAGGELFVVATGLLGKLPREADGFSLLAVGPAGSIGFIKQNPVVFALHGSPDAPPVDIYAGTAELAAGLAFGELSSPIQVPPGSYDLSFRVSSSGAEAAVETTPALAAGERYLAIASGFVGGQTPAFTLLPYADAFGLSGASARVRVVHASPDAPAVDVGTINGSNEVEAVADYTNLEFQEASPPIGTALPAGTTLSIGVAATSTTTPVAAFDVMTSAGLRAYAVAAGSLFGTGESFRLLIVDTTSFPWQVAEIMPN